MFTNDSSTITQYRNLLTIKGDLNLLEFMLSNIESMSEEVRSELEFFTGRINERLAIIVEDLCPPPNIPEA